ncbi:hypothetical protein EV421DRAFT_521853 [Armillaria borealis]|uniref:Uncharacterized protein n=1 Tax=Armillaria borealis TaxID=47425 RepID=A0AA39MRN8_9AGAR|nr:hypothetical protein EV421DRAFT_521853 [Armillaria borealis]
MMSLRFRLGTVVTSTKTAMLSKAFLREHAYAISLKVAKDIILFYLASTLLSGWSYVYRTITISVVFYTIRVISRNRDEEFAKAAKLDEIRDAYNDLNTYINDKMLLFQTTVPRKTEAYQLCSSTVIQYVLNSSDLRRSTDMSRQCIMSKQRGEAIYSSALEPTSPDKLNRIARNLRMQKAGILGAVGGYQIMASALDDSESDALKELEAAKNWVVYINARPLPAVPDSIYA